MNEEYIRTMAKQVMIFYLQLIHEGAEPDTANTLCGQYIAVILSMAGGGSK